MKLKVFDNDSRSANQGFRTVVRSIGANLTNGAVTFSSLLRKELGLETGDTVFFAQDEDSKEDWYLCKTKAENGIVLRAKKNGGWAKKSGKDGITLYFCNRLIVSQLLATIKAKHSASFLVATKPVSADGHEWYKLVTAKPLRAK